MTTPGPLPTEPDRAAPTAAGATHTVLAQIAARVAGVLATTGSIAIVARQTGADYADWGTVTSLVVLLSFALDPGLTPILVRRITQDPSSTPVPQSLVPLRLLLGLGTLAIVVGIAVAVRGGGIALLAVALGAQLVPRALVVNAMPWLQVDQRLHRQAVLEALAAAGGLAALGLAAALDASTPVLALVGFAVPVSLLALAVGRELRITPSRRFDVPGPQRERVISLLREVAPLAIALLITAAYTRTFVIFVNASDDSDLTTSNFLFAFNFVEQLLIVSGIVAGAILPLLTARARDAPLVEDAVTHRLLVAVTAAGTLGTAALLLLAEPLTRIIGGPSQAGADHFLVLLAPVSSVLLPAMVLAYVYVAIGQSGRYLRFALVGLAFNLAANAAFTLREGAVASARIVWGTEMLVLLMPIAAIVLAGPSGRAAGSRLAFLAGAAVLASELTAGDVVPPAVAAAGLLLAIAAVGGPALAWLWASMGLGRAAGRLRGRSHP